MPKPSGMNRTELVTFDWLLTQGYTESDITFQRRRSPDFLTADGKCWETKLARNNTAVFTINQTTSLLGCDCTIVVYEAEEPSAAPKLLVRYDDHPVPAQVGKYRFVLANGGADTVPVRVDGDLYEALVKVAKKHRRSATAELNDLVLTWLQVSEEWALPE